jgi:hypothetical protein
MRCEATLVAACESVEDPRSFWAYRLRWGQWFRKTERWKDEQRQHSDRRHDQFHQILTE